VPAAPLGLFGLPLGDTMLMRALFWAGVMSMSMGLVNLLPLPPLDGQRIAAGTVEWVLGRNAARSVETVLLVVASSVLFAVIVFAP
jgi:regulator of sigma E protease